MNEASPQLELRLAFMGGVRMHLGEYDLTQSALPKKAQAVLCYLILNPRTHSRQEIAGKFWPEVTEKNARVSLRVAINKMKEQGLADYILSPRPTLAFDHSTRYWCDVEAFENKLAEFRRGDKTDIGLLREAVDLYRGDFLDGFDAEDAFGFEEWMFNQREYLRQMALNALDDLVHLFLEREQFAPGIEYAHRLLELEPWRESAHRQLMWLYAKSGNRAVAMEQFEKCKEVLLNELGIEPDMETTAVYEEVKSLKYSTRPYQPLPPLADSVDEDEPPFQAPPLEKNFVGRLRSLARLEAALTAVSGNRRYGLVGMGGVGKTTLAVHLAHRLRPKFADGVLWATAVASDPMEIAERWANAFGYDFTGLKTLEERTLALRNMLAEKELLIVVDDVFVASTVKLLLPDSEKTAVLITSRRADVVFNLDARVINLEELSAEDSKQLLTNYIGHERVEKEAKAAAEICKLMQHLPLAVSIAGGYLSSRPRRPLVSFVDQLQSETDRLGLDHADREVRASISISWQGLDEVQKQVFAVLAVFDGRDFGAEAVAAIAEMDYFQVLDRLDDLVRLSLLQNSGSLRYRQHALLSDFAKEQLGDDAEAYGRMVAYFLQFARDTHEDFTALRPEWDNLDASVRVSYEQRRWQDVLGFTAVLQPALFARGRFTQARQMYSQAQEAAYALEDESGLGQTWLSWGVACMEQGDFTEARKWLEQALSLFRELGDKANEANCLIHLSRIVTTIHELEEAESLLTESMAIVNELEDQSKKGEIYRRQAVLLQRKGQNEEALKLSLQAVAIQKESGDEIELVRALYRSAFLATEMDQLETAKEMAVEAHSLALKLNDLNEQALMHDILSRVYLWQGELDQALALAIEQLNLLQKIGDKNTEASAYYLLALIYRKQKNYQAGHDAALLALQKNLEIHNKFSAAWAMLRVGDCLYGLKRSTEAVQSWEASKRLAGELGLNEVVELSDSRLNGQSNWLHSVQRDNDTE